MVQITKEIHSTNLKSFIYNVDINHIELSDGDFVTNFKINCKNDYQVKRVLKKYQVFAFYNTALAQYPQNEWLIFEVYQSKSSTDSHQIIGIYAIPNGIYEIPYRFVTSQKNEPDPRQVTLLRTLVQIL